jgi:hypothetical protein
MIDEGYIKFRCEFTPGPAPAAVLLHELNGSRQRMAARDLIGHDEAENVDYGNISIRGPAPGQILITGTQTGHLPELTPEHYALVTHCDIERNAVSCTGAVKASSETLTHAAIYALDPAIAAVIHVHHQGHWDRLLNHLPTTAANVAYGTPDMAGELARLYRDTELPDLRVAVMGGHPGGLISFGESLCAAEQALHQNLGT